jgi:hypothetical protein
MSGPSLEMGLLALIPSKSAVLPTRIPPLKVLPRKDPKAAAPELNKLPTPDANP